MIKDKNYWYGVIRKISVIIIITLFFCLAIKLSIFYIPFLIAFTISMLIEPVIKWLSRTTTLERKKSAIIVLIIFFSIIIGLLILGITTLITESSNLLSGINNYINMAYDEIQKISQNMRIKIFQNRDEINTIFQNATRSFLDTASSIISKVLQSILNLITSLPEIGIYIAITIIATYFICADRFYILDQIEHHLPLEWTRKIGGHVREILSCLGNYLKAEIILVGIDFIIILIGLIFMNILKFNIRYPLLVALGIGFVDALPLVGSGIVIVPWAVISALNGNIGLAIGLIVLLAIIIIVRQLLEPKVVSSHIGIHPIVTLIAMYTGYRFLGLAGMLIGPILLIILKSIFGNLIDKGVMKVIFDKK